MLSLSFYLIIKETKLYIRDDFDWNFDKRNGYRSPRPLICALEAEYNADGKFVGYVRDKMYDPLIQGVQKKVYSKESRMWTQKKKMILTTHSHAPDRSIASSSSSGSSAAYLALASMQTD